MKQDMSHQAAQFVQSNQLVISNVKKCLIDTAKQFLATVGSALPMETAKIAEDKIVQGEVVDFCLTIRPYAVPISKKLGNSNPFWDLIDACNFFWDATGTQWPYMTTEKRAQSLKWAAEHAAMVGVPA